MTTTTTFTVLFAPTTTVRTTWHDTSRDSYDIDFDVTFEREETFATFQEALKAARAFCGNRSVCCRLIQHGPLEFFANADAREVALRERETTEGCSHNYLACIVENKVEAPVAEANWVCPF